MTAHQVAVNHRAVANLAGRLESLGYTGDDVHEVAERLAAELLADGYRPVERPPAPSGPGASREAIEAALRAAREAVTAAKGKLPPAEKAKA